MNSPRISIIRRLSLFVLCMTFIPLAVFAQNITVKGNVSDPTGEPIIGASIKIDGTTQGTITDYDGNYTLSCSPKSVLIVSYLGYTTQKVSVNGKTSHKIVLQDDTKTLEEFVVVGYGVQRKSDLTGSVASVKVSDAIKQMPVSNVADALQGRMAGVTIVNSSGAPDAAPAISVRGINSIQGDSGPLIVIDGFIGGSLASLNPTDIASVEVLKDASATAVYGSRGANGVILVTTKQPDKGAVRVDFSTYFNVQTPYNLLKTLSPADYAVFANEYAHEMKLDKPYFTKEEVEGYQNGTLQGFDYLGNTFRQAALQSVNELSISGGSEAVRFLFSGSYNYNEGTIQTSKSERFNYNFKVDANVNKWLKVGFNTRGDFYQNQGADMRSAGYNPLLLNNLSMAPTILPRDPETGKYNHYARPDKSHPMYNPMGQIEQINNWGYTYNSYIQGFFDVQFMKGLNFRMQQSFNFGNTPSGSTSNKESYAASGIAGTGASGETSASATNRSSRGWLNTNILSYISSFNDNHRLNASLVFEQSSSSDFSTTASGTRLFWDNNKAYNSVGLSEYVGGGSSASETAIMSGMARLNYAMFNRYMFTVSYRIDGSSRLAYQNRWEGFAAGALAWDIRNEKFFRPAQHIFDQFKFRVGYGETGNQNIPAYSAYSKYQFNRTNTYLPETEQWATSTSMKLDERGNPDLRWERTSQWNVGLDMSLWKGRLTFTADAYLKDSQGVLMKVNLPAHTGYSFELRNAAQLINKGLEFTIGGNPVVTKNFSWNTNLVLSFGQTVVGDLGVDANGKPVDWISVTGNYSSGFYRYIKGQPIGTLYGYVDEGIWTTNTLGEFKDRMLKTKKADGSLYTEEDFKKLNYEPGQYRLKNAAGREFEKTSNDDQQIIGNGQPKFNWGWTNSVTVKNFDLALYVIGYHGFDVYNHTKATRDGFTPNPEMANRWKPAVAATEDSPAIAETENADRAGFILNRGGGTSTKWIEKGDFVKIKSITVGYSLPASALKKINFQRLRFYASVQNPFVITNYSGMDPEVTIGNFLTPGNDYGYYPNGRNFIVGLNLTF